MADKDKTIETALKRFKASAEAEDDQRRRSLEDIKFENGEQWEEEDLNARKGRPCLTINKTAGTVKQIIGDMRQNRPAIKVRPVDSEADVGTAELLNGIIRNIENVSDAESAYDMGGEQAVRGGIGFWRIVTDYADDESFDQDVMIKRVVNAQSVYFDPEAIEPDYSDAEYCFITETMSRDRFESQFPDHKPVELPESTGEEQAGWFTEDSVRVAEYYYKEPVVKELFELIDGRVVRIDNAQTMEVPDPQTGGAYNIVWNDEIEEPLIFKRSRKADGTQVMWCKMSGDEILEGPTKWAGKYIPVVPCIGEEIWIGGERIYRSAIAHAKDPARLYNWARSNAVETLALGPKQPFIVTKSMIEGYERYWDSAFTTPRPYLPINDGFGYPQRLTGSIGDSGALQEAMQAADDIKACTGLFDASLGNRGNETSGKAIIARQRQGDTATFVYPDNQARAIKHTGKILVDLIPKIYDTNRVVRLLGKDGVEAWAPINVMDPTTGKVVANDLSVGKYDVVVDAGPGYMTRRMEAADGMIMLAQAAPQYMPVLIPRIAANLDWPDANEIGKEIQTMNQMASQPPPPDPKADLDIEGKQLDNARKTVDLMEKTGAAEEQMVKIAQTVVAEALAAL